MADVPVSPRCYGDNLPLKIFEYLAAGRPIVATDLPAHRAVIDETRAALTELSADALARAIVDLLTRPDDAARRAAAASSYGAQQLGWHRFVESVAGICEGVAARAGDILTTSPSSPRQACEAAARIEAMHGLLEPATRRPPPVPDPEAQRV